MAGRGEEQPMKTALLITIGFPPEGGGGTIRVEKNAKYLPQFGWNLAVITAKPPKGVSGATSFPGARIYRAPRFDITLALVGVVGSLRRLLNTVRDVSFRSRIEPPSLCGSSDGGQVKSRRRLAEYVFIPDDRIVWVPLAILFGLLAVVRDRPAIIYSTSPSPSTHLVGYFLASLTGLPWVIEFRDPWMLNPFRIPRPFKWMETLEGIIEKKVFHKAQHIVVTSQEYKRGFLCRYPLLSPECISHIPNGFDPEDFAGVTAEPFAFFTIVHAGTFYEARSSAPFLEGVALALATDPGLKENFRVVFVGQHDLLTAAAIDRLSLDKVVSQVGIVSHRRSIEHLAGADLLLLIPGPGEGTMPGKVYEYLAARKPILALSDEGPVSALISSTSAGVVVSPEDIPGIAAAILSLYHAKTVNTTYGHVDNKVLKQFDRREIARNTASLLDDLVASG